MNYANANGTATAPSYYTALSSTLISFAPGQTSKTVTVLVNGDNVTEPDGTITLDLSVAVSAA